MMVLNHLVGSIPSRQVVGGCKSEPAASRRCQTSATRTIRIRAIRLAAGAITIVLSLTLLILCVWSGAVHAWAVALGSSAKFGQPIPVQQGSQNEPTPRNAFRKRTERLQPHPSQRPARIDDRLVLHTHTHAVQNPSSLKWFLNTHSRSDKVLSRNRGSRHFPERYIGIKKRYQRGYECILSTYQRVIFSQHLPEYAREPQLWALPGDRHGSCPDEPKNDCRAAYS